MNYKVKNNTCNECEEVKNDCSCPIELPTTCSYYVGPELNNIGHESGDYLTPILISINEALGQNLEVSLVNVGAGAKLYSGLNVDGNSKIRSLKSENGSVVITEDEDEVNIEVSNEGVFEENILFKNINVSATGNSGTPLVDRVLNNFNNITPFISVGQVESQVITTYYIEKNKPIKQSWIVKQSGRAYGSGTNNIGPDGIEDLEKTLIRESTTILLGDIGTQEVHVAVNNANPNLAINVGYLIEATQGGQDKVWFFQGLNNSYGQNNTQSNPSDFILLTEEETNNPIGELNTASNVGGQKEVYKEKVDENFVFRTLEGKDSIEVTQESNTLSIKRKITQFEYDSDFTLNAIHNHSKIFVDPIKADVDITIPNSGLPLYFECEIIQVNRGTVKIIADGFQLQSKEDNTHNAIKDVLNICKIQRRERENTPAADARILLTGETKVVI